MKGSHTFCTGLRLPLQTMHYVDSGSDEKRTLLLSAVTSISDSFRS